jgi:DNA-directed RNA polymerase subunit beta'
MAYEAKQVDLHAYIYVRFDGEIDSGEPDTEPLEVTEDKDDKGKLISRTLKYKFRRVREDAQGNVISQYIYTTPGRAIYNKAIQEAIEA